MPESIHIPESRPQPLFVTTRWSVVLAAQDKESPHSAAALETLCATYWYPLYAFVRGLGHAPPDAQDLTQEFFALLLAKDYLRVVTPEKGRFRTFLRMAMQHFLSNERDRRRAKKRGGGRTHVPFDTALAERRFQDEPAGSLPPDCIYDRGWALTLLQEAMKRLETAYREKPAEWQAYHPHLTDERHSIPYGEIAAALGISEGAARVAMHRMRKSFREIFRAAVADTVSSPGEVDGEMRHVLEILSHG
jgi:RNA polymerase sigma-70 factor (ECF subfamily)